MNRTLLIVTTLLALFVSGQALAERTITGTVKDKSGRPIAHARVIAWDADPTSADDRMGEARTDRRGRFTIRYPDKRWDGLAAGPKLGDSWLPDVYVTVAVRAHGQWQRIGRSPVSKNHPNGKDMRISLKLDRRQALRRHMIVGTIRDRRGRPIRNAVVKAFDKDLGKNELMGSARTDRRGRYRIVYRDRRWDGFGPFMGKMGNPDIFLVVKAKRHDGKSRVHKNHPVDRTLRIDMNLD